LLTQVGVKPNWQGLFKARCLGIELFCGSLTRAYTAACGISRNCRAVLSLDR
jgi:hypothetical protein